MGGPKEGLDCLSLLQTNERILDFLWFNIPLARMGLLQPPSTTCTWFSNLFLMSLMTTQLLVKGPDGTHLSAFPCNPKGRSDAWRTPGVCCVKSYVSNVRVRMFTNLKRTDLLVNVGMFRNVTFYTTDPSVVIDKSYTVIDYYAHNNNSYSNTCNTHVFFHVLLATTVVVWLVPREIVLSVIMTHVIIFSSQYYAKSKEAKMQTSF